MNPLNDPIVQLLETPFRRWSNNNKNELVRLGKPTPMLSCLSKDKKGGKEFSRVFNSNWYKIHIWLCGSHYNQALYCWPCLLLSRTVSVWTTKGYSDFKNLSRSIKIHESAKEHIHSMLGLKNLENNSLTIADALTEHGSLFKKKFNENVRLNRLFMEHLIDIVLFLGRQELAFRGHDESSNSLNKGNFKELFEMHIIRCSLEIQNHYSTIKNVFSGLSNTIQNELISCISQHVLNCIKSEIKQCMFFSVQVDDTTDIFQRTQCSIIVRYLTDKSELVERFLGFFNVSENRSAEGLFNLLNYTLLEFDIKNKLVGQCYDGASVMAGHINGLQAKVIEIAPNALFTHCLAHRLNLVLQHGCSANTQCRIFFANITGISSFFHNSTARTNVVDSIIGKRMPQFVQTRWASRSKILHLLVDKWNEFKTVFEIIINNSNSSPESICGSIGHLKNLKSFDFAFMAQIFSRIFLLTDSLYNILQTKSFDIEYCMRQINIVHDLISKKRNDSEFLIIFNNAIALTKQPKATRTVSNPELNYKALYFEILDNILVQINTRFQNNNKLIFLQLGDVSKFELYSRFFPQKALENLEQSYSNLLFDIKKLKVELEVLYNDKKYQNLNHVYDLIKIFENDGLKVILPEVYKLFSLILTIPSTSVSVERSFSCLKRIKTYLRNSISQNRLSSLAVMSIEKGLIENLKNTEVFYDPVIDIYSNLKNRNIDLQYKK